MFSPIYSFKYSNKVELEWKCCFRNVLNDDNKSDYETLIETYSRTTINTKWIRIVAIEIFKTIDDINSSFMKEIFKSENPRIRPNDFVVKNLNTATYGDNFLTTLDLRHKVLSQKYKI